MSPPPGSAAFWFACFVVPIQIGFGALEMFGPRRVLKLVFGTYEATSRDPVWSETVKVALNMGLYNWFLALGLALSLSVAATIYLGILPNRVLEYAGRSVGLLK